MSGKMQEVMLFANCPFQVRRLRVVSEAAIFRTQILKRKVYWDSQFLRFAILH